MLLALAVWLLGFHAGTDQGLAVPPVSAVVLQVTMPSGSLNRLTIVCGRHGSAGAVNGSSLDLAPTLRDDGTLEIAVTAVVRDQTAHSSATLDAERQVLQLGEAARAGDGIFPVAVKWIGTVVMAASAGPDTGTADTDRCCVSCGSEMSCACHVTTPCGDCCGTSCGCQSGAIARHE